MSFGADDEADTSATGKEPDRSEAPDAKDREGTGSEKDEFLGSARCDTADPGDGSRCLPSC